MKEKLIKILQSLGLYNDENKEDIEKKLNEIDIRSLVEEEKKIELPKGMDEATKQIVESLISQNKALVGNIKALKDALAEEKAQREAAIKAEQERQQKEAKQKIETAVKKLLDEKKITEADKETWTKLFEKDFEATEKLASQLTSQQKQNKQNTHSQNKQDERNENIQPGKVDRRALRDAIAEQMELDN